MSIQENIIKHNYQIKREDRALKNGHNSFVLWFTGLSGSGKSTIANAVEKLLFDSGIKTYTLDGDNIRSGINKGLTFSEEDRLENLRRIAEISKLFVDAGFVTIGAFVSPLNKDRDLVRNTIGESDFIEIYVNTSVEECARRDVKGLYKKAFEGKIANFTGVNSPYEPPKSPDVEIDTLKYTIEESAKLVFDKIKSKLNYSEL